MRIFPLLSTSVVAVLLVGVMSPRNVLSQPLRQSLWDNVPENIRSRNSFKRTEWFYRQRALPNDTIPSSIFNMERAREMAKASRRGIESFDLTWTPVGPVGIQNTWPPQWGVVSGRIKSIVVDPNNPNVVYIGAASGGIWKTTNGGTSWLDIGQNLESLTFGAITLNPLNPNTVYAAGGEIIVYGGAGLFKSMDAGATWTNITNGFGSYTNFSSIKVSPTDTNLVYATIGGSDWLYSPGNEGIWRSTNGGTTWTRTGNYYAGRDVLPHPSVAGKVYAATGAYWSGTAGFYYSSNSGATWAIRNTGLPASGSIDRIQLTSSPASPSSVFALVETVSPDMMTLYKTTNDGVSWSAASSSIVCDGGYWNLLAAINPSDANEIYLGENELHRSTDGGSTFNFVGGDYWNQSMHVDFHGVAFAPSNPAIRYCISDGGVYRSSDGGSTWTSINNGLSTIQFYRMASHTTSQNIILGGAQDNGIFKTTNGGSGTWALVSTGDGMESFYDYTDPNFVYSATQNGNLLKSTSGATWGSWVGVKPVTADAFAWLTPFFMHPTSPAILYTASTRPWKSTNSGSTWIDLSGAPLIAYPSNTMAQSPAEPNNLMFSEGAWASNPDVYVSSTGTTPWTNIKANIGGSPRFISRIVFHPDQANTVFIVRTGFTSGSPGNKLYRSTNLGTTWTNLTGNLPNVPHNDLFIDPLNTNYMYAANDLGIYRTTDDGVTWNRMGSGMPFVPALDFSYFNSAGVRLLRVATYGRGAFQAVLSPVATSLISPANDASGQSLTPTLTWGAVPTAGWYQIQVSTDSTFGTITQEDSGLTATSKQIGPLEFGTRYYWRVRALNSAGEGPHSPAWSFTTSAFTINVAASWNIISVPLLVEDYQKTVLFPSAISDAFAYEGTYVDHDTLQNKIGYWLKFAAADGVLLSGYPISSDTIPVNPGWNLVGSISNPVPVNTIGSIPGGIVTSPFFQFGVGGYTASKTLEPGSGYWVKSDQTGSLILSSSPAQSANRIRITPGPELPPPPPKEAHNGE